MTEIESFFAPAQTNSNLGFYSLTMEDSSLPSTISLSRPLKFPAILQNPKVSASLLQGNKPRKSSKSAATSLEKRSESTSKRSLNRLRNSTFAENPHLVKATKSDYASPLNPYQSQFSPPPPSGTFPRSLYVQPIDPLAKSFGNDISNTLGKFSMSQKGIKKNLASRSKNGEGGRAGIIVEKVEREIRNWIRGDLREESGRVIDETMVDEKGILTEEGGGQAIIEIGRSLLKLEWVIRDDYTRYVCHCLARWYSLISYSKEVGGIRTTSILRPALARPDLPSLDTPPTTDLSASDFNYDESDEVESSIGDQEEDLESEKEEEAGINVEGDGAGRPTLRGRTMTSESVPTDEDSTKEDSAEDSIDFHSSDEEDDEDGEISFCTKAINGISLPTTPRPSQLVTKSFSPISSGHSTPRPMRHSFHTTRPSKLSNMAFLSTTVIEPIPTISPNSTSASAMAIRAAMNNVRDREMGGRQGIRSSNSSPSRSPTRMARPRVVTNNAFGRASPSVATAAFKRKEELPTRSFANFLGFKEEKIGDGH